MKKLTVIVALLLVVALATPAIGQSFPDVPSNHWAYEAVNQLVAAGIIEGYPDGTYKGQRNLTRYEIAMIVSRALDNIAEERQALMEKVESMEDKDSGLSTAQAQDVTAIVKSLIEKNMPEPQEPPTELTEQQADQVVNLIEALTFEYQAELKVLGSDIDELQMDMAEVEERVAALENEVPTVTFDGEIGIDMRNIETSGPGTPYVDPFNTDNGTFHKKWPGSADNIYDEGMYGQDYFYQWADVNTHINGDNFEATLNMRANQQHFDDASGVAYLSDWQTSATPEVYHISGTIYGDTFDVEFGDEIDEQYTSYLMYDNAADLDNVYYPWENTTEVGGFKVIGDNGFNMIVGKNGEVDSSADTDDDDDVDYLYDRLTLAGTMPVNLRDQKVNIYFGHERYSNFKDNDTDDTITSFSMADKSLLGMDFETNVGNIELTPEFVVSKSSDLDSYGYSASVNAVTELDLLKLDANAKYRTAEFTPIREAWYLGYAGTLDGSSYDDKGFDVTATLPFEFGNSKVTVEGYYESYNSQPLMYVDADLESELGGFDVTGNFRHEVLDANGNGNTQFGQQLRNLKAKNQYGMFTVTGEYVYEADDESIEPYEGYGFTHTFDWDDEHTIGFDEDMNKVVGTIDAQLNENVSAYLETTYRFGDYSGYNPGTQTWDDPGDDEIQVDVGGEMTYGIATASVDYEAKGVDAGDTDLSLSLNPETRNLMGIELESKLETTYYIEPDDSTAYNLLVDIDGTYDVTDKLAATAGYEYNRKYELGYFAENEDAIRDEDNDDSYENLFGVLHTFNAGLEYSFSEDVSATMDYKKVKFNGKDSADDYRVGELTAGVSLAF